MGALSSVFTHNVKILLLGIAVAIVLFCLYNYFFPVREGFETSLTTILNSSIATGARAGAGAIPVTEAQKELLKQSGLLAEGATVATDPSRIIGLEALCANISEPSVLPGKTGAVGEGCGWYFKEDPDEFSFPAYGNKYGPLNPALKDIARGGQWYFDNLDKAQKAEDVKRCQNIKTCQLADLHPGKCAWCGELGYGIPIDESGLPKYPDDDSLNCLGAVTTNINKCKYDAQEKIYQTDADGNLLPQEANPKPVCSTISDFLSKKCLLFLAKATGIKEGGAVYRVINGDPDGYNILGSDNNRIFKAAFDVLNYRASIPYDRDFLGGGNCARDAALSYYKKIVKQTAYGVNPKTRSAALFLVRGDSFKPDDVDHNAMPPFDLKLLQLLFKEAGGQEAGTGYPTKENIDKYNNGKKLGYIISAINQTCVQDIASTDINVKLDAIKKCLGINIQDAVACCNLKIPNFVGQVQSQNVGNFIVAGGKAKLAYSQDGGVTYTVSQSGSNIFPAASAAQVYFVANNSTQWLAGGTSQNGAKLAMSTDGVNWTHVRTMDNYGGSNGSFDTAIWTGSQWIMQCTNLLKNYATDVLISPNGTDWSLMKLNFSNISQIAINGSTVVMSGTNVNMNDGHAINYSTDGGKTFKVSTSADKFFKGDGGLYTLSYGGGKFIAGGCGHAWGGPPVIIYSNDGITWVQADISKITTGRIWNVYYVHNRWLASTQAEIITSVDGIIWTACTIPESPPHLCINKTAVSKAGTGFIAGLTSGALTSDDGKVWKTQTTLSRVFNQGLNAIAVGYGSATAPAPAPTAPTAPAPTAPAPTAPAPTAPAPTAPFTVRTAPPAPAPPATAPPAPAPPAPVPAPPVPVPTASPAAIVPTAAPAPTATAPTAPAPPAATPRQPPAPAAAPGQPPAPAIIPPPPPPAPPAPPPAPPAPIIYPHAHPTGPITLNGPAQMRKNDDVTFSITGSGIYANTTVFWYYGDIFYNKTFGAKITNSGVNSSNTAILHLSNDRSFLPNGTMVIGAFIPSMSKYIGTMMNCFSDDYTYPIPPIKTPSLPPPAPPIQHINYISQPTKPGLATNIKAQWVFGNNDIGGQLKVSFTEPTKMDVYAGRNGVKSTSNIFGYNVFVSPTPSSVDSIPILYITFDMIRSGAILTVQAPPGMKYISISSLYTFSEEEGHIIPPQHWATYRDNKGVMTNWYTVGSVQTITKNTSINNFSDFMTIVPNNDNLVLTGFTPSYVPDTKVKSGVQILKPRCIYLGGGYNTFDLFWAQLNDITDPNRAIKQFSIKATTTQDNTSPTQKTVTLMNITGDLKKYLAVQKGYFSNVNVQEFSFYKVRITFTIDTPEKRDILQTNPYISIWALTQGGDWIYSEYVNSASFMNGIVTSGPIQIFSNDEGQPTPPTKELNALEASKKAAEAAAQAAIEAKAAADASAAALAKKAADDAASKRAAAVAAASTPEERAACFKAREWCLNAGGFDVIIKGCIASNSHYRVYNAAGGPCAAVGPKDVGCGDCSPEHFYSFRNKT